ncbi:MAG: hypothetical protein ACOYJO_01110 [Eubacterium sp.]
MSREWQQTKMTEYLMPDAVYYQSLWAVRDYQRMEKRIRELHKDLDTGGSSVVNETGDRYTSSSKVEKKALELALLEDRVDGIKRAISGVPREYRAFILSNIILKNSGAGFPDKVWRSWKQKFLYDVAHNLSMM